MSQIAPSRNLSEYGVLFGFALASVIVVWILSRVGESLHAAPILTRTVVVSGIPILFSMMFNEIVGRVLLAVMVLVYIQHELHILT